MLIQRKNFIGFVIGTFLIAGISGGFTGYFLPRNSPRIVEEEIFNVVIDGNFSAVEGWQYSDWQFIEYLITDDDNLNTNNFFYIHLTNSSLYILIDFASDITDDTTDEFLAIWIDTDNSLTEFYTADDWNSQAKNPGHELLCFIPETGNINDTLHISGLLYSTTLNESNSIVKFGFQSSINSPYPHRIFEIEIDRVALKGLNSTNFNIGFSLTGISDGFIGFFYPRMMAEGTFNAVIDGNFSAEEGWQYSDWQFIEYLITDDDNLNTHNFFYIHLTNSSLYILIDFASDITNDTTDEFLAVWIDTDNSLSDFDDDDKWNSKITNPGHELLCFIPETETFNNTLRIVHYEYPIFVYKYLTTLNESNSIVKFGFQSSINSPYLHRIFEIEIDRVALKGLNSTNFNIGFFGYGTVYQPIYPDLGFWGAPSLFASEFYHRNYWIREQTFFKCGYGVIM